MKTVVRANTTRSGAARAGKLISALPVVEEMRF